MDLDRELSTFQSWLKRYALPGFSEKARDTYTETFGIAYDELSSLGFEMRKAVDKNDKGHFEICKELYLKLFSQINTEIARNIYADILDEFLDQFPTNNEAKSKTLALVWNDPLLSYWLPAQARMSGPQGEEVFLVANERHIPQGKNYVMTSEIEFLKNSGLNPWEYVQNRRAYANQKLA